MEERIDVQNDLPITHSLCCKERVTTTFELWGVRPLLPQPFEQISSQQNRAVTATLAQGFPCPPGGVTIANCRVANCFATVRGA